MSLNIELNLNSTICRFCLRISQKLANLFSVTEPGNVSIACKVAELFGLEVQQEAELPSKLCEECLLAIDSAIKFKNTLLKSLSILKEKQLVLIQNVNTKDNIDKYKPVKTVVWKAQTEKTEKLIKCELEEKEKKYPRLKNALKNNQCLLCLQQFQNNDSLRVHVNGHIAGTNLDPYYNVGDKNILCRECNTQYNYRFAFIEHQRQHLHIKPFICKHEGCGQSFYSRTVTKQHETIHADRDFICTNCGAGFKRRSDLKTHETIHTDEDSLFTCSVCYKTMKNRITLMFHLKTHTSTPEYKCPHCSKAYHIRGELARHMLSHATEKQFVCQCRSSYLSKSALMRHIRESCVMNMTKT